jgi:hypothetical protein
MKLTQEQLEAIRQRAEKATPGPWEIRWGEVVTKHPDHQNVSQWYDGYSNAICSLNDGEYIINSNEDNDATFIAHARTDIPALLDHIAELEAELEKYRKILHGELRIVIKKNDVPILDLDGVTLSVEKPVKEDDQ